MRGEYSALLGAIPPFCRPALKGYTPVIIECLDLKYEIDDFPKPPYPKSMAHPRLRMRALLLEPLLFIHNIRILAGQVGSREGARSLSVLGCPTNLDNRAYSACTGCGWECLDFFCRQSFVFYFSLSFGDGPI